MGSKKKAVKKNRVRSFLMFASFKQTHKDQVKVSSNPPLYVRAVPSLLGYTAAMDTVDEVRLDDGGPHGENFMNGIPATAEDWGTRVVPKPPHSWPPAPSPRPPNVKEVTRYEDSRGAVHMTIHDAVKANANARYKFLTALEEWVDDATLEADLSEIKQNLPIWLDDYIKEIK